MTFIQQHTGIYTTTHWHLYNNTLAFIQQHTGIYTTTHWHLYNNTLAFIQQHTGIYTTTHWHLYNNTLAFIQVMSFIRFLLNSSWHSAMNGMQTNKMCAIHGRVLPNFSFFFPNSSWHSAMNGMQTNKMCAIHGRVLPNFFFFSFFSESIYTNPKLLAFIQETCWHLYKKKTCWHLYKRVSWDSVSLGGVAFIQTQN